MFLRFLGYERNLRVDPDLKERRISRYANCIKCLLDGEGFYKASSLKTEILEKLPYCDFWRHFVPLHLVSE